MRRILVVDDDPHICLAIRAWLQRYGFRVSIADAGVNGFAALDNATFDLMVVDIFMLRYARLRFDHDVSRTRSGGAVDRDFQFRVLGIGSVKSRLPDNGRQAWRDAMPPQTFQADDIARRR